MTEKEDFIIRSPYQKIPEDNVLISQASPTENQASDWEKSCLRKYKDRLRDYYLVTQKRRCAYCRTIIKTSQVSPEIEHIIAKDLVPKWMYESFNLCISCKMCNTKKSIKKVLNHNEYVSLPVTSDSYIIVHPHIDCYSQHIRLIEGILYEGLTDKGKETISVCGLDRYELAADRAEDKIRECSLQFDKVLLALIEKRERPLVNFVERLKERIKQIIEDYKE